LKTSGKPLLIAAALALALAGTVTFAGAVTLWLVMPLITALIALLNPVAAALHIALGFAGAFFLLGEIGGLPALFTGAFFLVPAAVMGRLYRRGASARTAVAACFLSVLAVLLLQLMLAQIVFRFDPAAGIREYLERTAAQLGAGDPAMMPGNWEDAARDVAKGTVALLPTLLMIAAFALTVVNQYLGRRILGWAGMSVPGLPPIRTWRLPRHLVFIYLVALIAGLFPLEGFLGGAVNNLLPLLRLAFTVQAVGFLFFVADVRRWPRVVPVLLSAPALLIPPFYLVGLLDTAFPLRKYFVK